MKSFAAAAALVSLVPRILALTVNTPSSVVQCQPQLLSWADGTAPYYVSVIPGGQPSAAPLKTFPPQTGNSLTWFVDIAAGTIITIVTKDSTGATAYSEKVQVQQSSDSSCLNGGGSGDSAPPPTQDTSVTSGTVTGATTPAPATTAPATGGTTRAATTAAATTGANRTPSVTASSPASTGTASRPATTNVSGAESRFSFGNVAFIGFLGLLGAIFV